MWPCYEMFTNNTIRTSLQGFGQDGQYKGDMAAGYFQQKYESGYNEFAYQTVASVASGNGWDFKSFIRRVNIMLSHIDNSSMTEAQKDHWRAVGYFFHSFWYMELIDRFGDVPWVDQVLQEDSPEAYGPRVDRKTVADKVLERLQWAEQNIGNFTSQDGDNTINQDCVRAVISRFGLREGTWRKYHELGDAEKYLQECVRASELLMAAYPTLYTGTDGQPGAGYGEMWTTEDLGQVPGIILYKSYVKDINPMGMSYIEHTSSHYVEMNQNTVDLYLMKNGKPILADGSGYHGNKDMYAVFRDRDPRLYHTVIPPYKVKSGKGDYPTWSYTDNPADREYIDIMGATNYTTNSDMLTLLALRVKEYRLAARMSQKELAEQSGVSQTTISHFEQGVSRNLTLANFISLLRALGQEQRLAEILPELPMPPMALREIEKLIPKRVRRGKK